MIRRITDVTYLYLCQTADWQCIIEAEDEETAATIAIENAMAEENQEEKLGLTASVLVKKIQNNLYTQASEEDLQVFEFYCPMILANAGFHSEAKSLEEFLDNEKENIH